MKDRTSIVRRMQAAERELAGIFLELADVRLALCSDDAQTQPGGASWICEDPDWYARRVTSALAALSGASK